MLQMPFVTELFELAHRKGVHTTLDTAGQPYRKDAEYQKAFERMMAATDLVMLDLKAMDAQLHRARPPGWIIRTSSRWPESSATWASRCGFGTCLCPD